MPRDSFDPIEQAQTARIVPGKKDPQTAFEKKGMTGRKTTRRRGDTETRRKEER